MNAKIDEAASTADREILMSRVFNAPRELVFKAWTDPQQVPQWWGPTGFTTTTFKMEVKPGGVWRFVTHGPDGRDYQNKVTYLEVVAPERLVYKHGGDKDVEPVNFEVTVTFEDQGGKTRLAMRMVFPSTAARDHVIKTYGAVEGGKQTLARLGEHLTKLTGKSGRELTLTLPSALEIMLTRVFHAPRRLVFEAHTKPEHIKRWWGLHGSDLSVCDVDFRPGGQWRYVIRMPDGSEHPFKGVYREIVPPERFSRTFIYDVEYIRDHEALETLIFEEQDGKTTLTSTILHKTVEARDGHLQSGMEPGAAETMDRLEELLRTMS